MLEAYFFPRMPSCPFGWNSKERIQWILKQETSWQYEIEPHGAFYRIREESGAIQNLLQLENAKLLGYLPLLNVIVGIVRLALFLFALIESAVAWIQINQSFEKLAPAKKSRFKRDYERMNAILENSLCEASLQCFRAVCEIPVGPLLYFVDDAFHQREERFCKEHKAGL